MDTFVLYAIPLKVVQSGHIITDSKAECMAIFTRESLILFVVVQGGPNNLAFFELE